MTSSKPRILDYLYCSALFLLVSITLVLVFTNLLFFIGITITPWHLPIIYVFSIGLFLVWQKKDFRRGLIAVIIASAVFAISGFAIGKIYDATADGNTYHKLAVGALKNGWNPQYQKIKDFSTTQGNPFDIYEDNVNVKWVDHYARGTETFAAVAYAFTGNIETGKVYNFLWIYIGMFILYGILMQFKLKTWQSLLIAIIMAFNPIILTQVTNFYLDGVLSIALFIAIFICALQFKWQRPEYRTENYLILTMAIIWCVNAKFTGLALVVVFCGTLFLAKYIYKFVKKEQQIKRKLFHEILYYLGVALVAVVVVGGSTYTKNFLEHGHPFYPLYGEGHVENMVMMELPTSMQNYSHLQVFLTSIYAIGENVSPSYATIQTDPTFKIPFATSITEISHYSVPDIRMGGGGPMFSGIFTITIIGTVVAIVLLVRQKKWEELIVYFILLGTTATLILALDGGYWFRYVPYVYLLPIYLLIFLFGQGELKEKGRIFNIAGIVIATLCLINFTLIAAAQIKTTYDSNIYISRSLENFAAYASSHDDVAINLSHHGIQGVQYTLDDWDISNYHLTDNPALKTDGYMFKYQGD